jgi:hypothetical protein
MVKKTTVQITRMRWFSHALICFSAAAAGSGAGGIVLVVALMAPELLELDGGLAEDVGLVEGEASDAAGGEASAAWLDGVAGATGEAGVAAVVEKLCSIVPLFTIRRVKRLLARVSAYVAAGAPNKACCAWLSRWKTSEIDPSLKTNMHTSA